MSWSSEEDSRGCYAGYLPPGVWPDYGDQLRAPVGRVHRAGTETATEWNGYLDGAVRSGHRVASEILGSGNGQTAVPVATTGPQVHRPTAAHRVGTLAATGADTAVEAVGAAALAAAAAAHRASRAR